MSELQLLAPVPGFDGYHVTQDGTVTGPRGRALKPNRSGFVGVYRDGKQIWTPASELVALAWGHPLVQIASTPPAPQVADNAAWRAERAQLLETIAKLKAELEEATRHETLRIPHAESTRLHTVIARQNATVATLEADLSTVTRQRDKALRQRDALAATRLIEVAQPRARARRVRQ